MGSQPLPGTTICRWVRRLDRNIEFQANTQGCKQVLDPRYLPKYQADRDRFNAQNEFICSVFESKLTMNIDKDLVCKHRHNMNGQMILETSTTTWLSAADRLAYITSAKFGNGPWVGTSEQFILHCKNQVLIYNNVSTEKITPNLTMTMLQNVLQEIRELASVKITWDKLQSHMGVPMGLYNYLSTDFCNRII